MSGGGKRSSSKTSPKDDDDGARREWEDQETNRMGSRFTDSIFYCCIRRWHRTIFVRLGYWQTGFTYRLFSVFAALRHENNVSVFIFSARGEHWGQTLSECACELSLPVSHPASVQDDGTLMIWGEENFASRKVCVSNNTTSHNSFLPMICLRLASVIVASKDNGRSYYLQPKSNDLTLLDISVWGG